jgi:hypothetical protein
VEKPAKHGRIPSKAADEFVDGRPSPTMTTEGTGLASRALVLADLMWMAGTSPGHDGMVMTRPR